MADLARGAYLLSLGFCDLKNYSESDTDDRPTQMAASATESLFSIQTDTVLDDGTTDLSSPSTTDDGSSFGSSTTVDDSSMEACATPLMTGYRPYYGRSGFDPYGCGGWIQLQNETLYCCNGKLIDRTQPLKGAAEMCLENIRCCSGDPDVTLGYATTCTAGSEARVVLDSSISSEYYATQSSSTTTEANAFGTITRSSPAASSPTNTSNAGHSITLQFPLFGTILMLWTLLKGIPSS